MNPFSSRATSALSGAGQGVRLGLYGKVPEAGDFCQYGPGDGAAEVFRSWLESGVGWRVAREPDAWRLALSDSRVFAFVFRAADRQLLVGALRPSRDAVGRNFPLSAYAVLDGASARDKPHVLPLSLGELVQNLAEVLLAPDPPLAIAALDASPAKGGLLSLEDDATGYAAWAEATPLAGAWAAVYGTEQGPLPAQAVHAVQTIWEAVSPWRGREEPPTPLSVRVPLGGAGVAASAFWIDVVRRAAGWQCTVPTVFWSIQDGSGEALVQLGDVPPSSLSELWLPNPDSDHVCDLTRPAVADLSSMLGRLPDTISLALGRGAEASVAQFLMSLQG